MVNFILVATTKGIVTPLKVITCASYTELAQNIRIITPAVVSETKPLRSLTYSKEEAIAMVKQCLNLIKGSDYQINIYSQGNNNRLIF